MDKEQKIVATPETRRRVTVGIGNPLIKTEAQVQDYNYVCELVAEHNVSRLIMEDKRLFLSIGRETKSVRYAKGIKMDWIETQIETFKAEIEYQKSADSKRVIIFTIARSAGLVKAIEYALTLNPTINRQDDSIVITADTLTYAFNMNNLTIKDNKTVSDMFKLKRLEALLEKHKK